MKENAFCGRDVIANYRRTAKSIVIRRLIILILFTYLSHVAQTAFAQTVSVSLSGRNLPAEKIFSEVRKQTGYVFTYTADVIVLMKPVTIDAKALPLSEFLNLVFSGQPVGYTVQNKSILLSKRPENVRKNEMGTNLTDIVGTVIDSTGISLPGATVFIKGTSRKVVADGNGIFEIEASEGEVIVASYVGYKSRELRITAQHIQKENIGLLMLNQAPNTMGAVEIVVNTGYQSMSRARSAGSVANVNMSTVANRSSSTNLLQRLDGLVPGLVVNNAPSGEPLLIRGLTSLNSTRSPLIVVDGVELPSNITSTESQNNVFNSSNPIANINPQDIADISVLKDASAASIWGAKAANGVIVITTKKGKNGEKLRVEYDGFYNFQGKPDRTYIQRMNSSQFITAAKELFPQYVPYYSWGASQTLAPVPPHLQIQYNLYRGLITQAQADKSLDSLAAIDNRAEILDLYYRNAATTNHTVSLSGGNRIYSFYGSLSYTGIQSTTPGEKNNTYKVNLRQDFNANERVQFSIITDLTNTVTGASNLGSSITDPGVSFVPYQRFRDASGNALPVNFLGAYSDSLRLDYAARSRVNLDYVPLQEFDRGYSKGSNIAGRVVGSAKIKLVKGLRFEGTYGYQTFSSNNRVVLDEQSYIVRNRLVSFTQAPMTSSIPRYWLPERGGTLTVNNASQKNWTVRNQLFFDQAWGNHQLTVMAGQEATSMTPLLTSSTYYGWDDQLQLSKPVNVDTLMKGINGTVPGRTMVLDVNNVRGGEGAIARTVSYYSTIAYMFRNKYAFNASWRIDQSNLFGLAKSAQNRPVYSVGGKWLLKEENFMQQVNWIDRLDFRLTYGIAGNAPRPAQAASFDILKADANVNYVTGSGLIVSTPGNDKLTWEGTTVYNTGLDFDILGGRLSGTIDGYLKKTTDLIGPLATAPLTGYATVTGNYGDLENKGVELSLTSFNLKNRNYYWSTTLNIAYNSNKITRLATETAITTGTGMIDAMFERPYFEGHPAFANVAFRYGGLNTSGDPQIIQADGKLLSTRNGSKPEDMLFMATSQPVWTGGLFNTFEYKGFQLGINISFNLGYKLFRDVNTFWTEPLFQNAAHPEFANRWKQPGDEKHTNIPRYAYNTDISESRNTIYYQYADINVFNGAYAKIREITLAYSLPKSVVHLINAQGLTFRAQVSNLMLWKANHLGIDPEFHSAGGARFMRTGQGSLTIGAHLIL